MSNTYIDILTKNLEKRESQDKPLFSYYKVVFIGLASVRAVFSWEIDTFSILFLLIMYKGFYVYPRIKRLNDFIERKKEWYQTIAQLVSESHSNSKKAYKLTDVINQNLACIKPISILCFFILNVGCVIAFSIFMKTTNQSTLEYIVFCSWLLFIVLEVFVCGVPLNNRWNRLQYFEYEFDTLLSGIWKENHWIDRSLSFVIDPKKERNYFVWVLYSIFSVGIMGIIWDYRIHTDPNNMYAQFHEKEDQILKIISQHLES